MDVDKLKQAAAFFAAVADLGEMANEIDKRERDKAESRDALIFGTAAGSKDSIQMATLPRDPEPAKSLGQIAFDGFHHLFGTPDHVDDLDERYDLMSDKNKAAWQAAADAVVRAAKGRDGK